MFRFRDSAASQNVGSGIPEEYAEAGATTDRTAATTTNRGAVSIIKEEFKVGKREVTTGAVEVVAKIKSVAALIFSKVTPHALIPLFFLLKF